MRLLHTSDWHLGRRLYGRKRYDEFGAFLHWLADTVEQRGVEALLVAGEVFDTSTPSHRAQALYYHFLRRVAASPCRHVVITAGNHDSPSFLNAPRELLKALDVHVLGAATERPEDEVLLLEDSAGKVELIVCAVPYLHDRDVRIAEAGESLQDKDSKLLAGIRRHYGDVFAAARARRDALDEPVPLVAMGHLFTAGGRTLDGDGVRELYVGSLAHVGADVFPPDLAYTALGHLHVPQTVAGSETVRYSGSPIPMGFGEARQQKSVCLVDLEPSGTRIERVEVPRFQRLARIEGDWDTLAARILETRAAQPDAWLEVVYSGDEIIPDLRRRLDEAIADSGLEILRVRNNRIVQRALSREHPEQSLDDLDEQEVFARCLDRHAVPEHQRAELRHTYGEVLASLRAADAHAE